MGAELQVQTEGTEKVQGATWPEELSFAVFIVPLTVRELHRGPDTADFGWYLFLESILQIWGQTNCIPCCAIRFLLWGQTPVQSFPQSFGSGLFFFTPLLLLFLPPLSFSPLNKHPVFVQIPKVVSFFITFSKLRVCQTHVFHNFPELWIPQGHRTLTRFLFYSWRGVNSVLLGGFLTPGSRQQHHSRAWGSLW